MCIPTEIGSIVESDFSGDRGVPQNAAHLDARTQKKADCRDDRSEQHNRTVADRMEGTLALADTLADSTLLALAIVVGLDRDTVRGKQDNEYQNKRQ